jgi:hypothetical protein
MPLKMRPSGARRPSSLRRAHEPERNSQRSSLSPAAVWTLARGSGSFEARQNGWHVSLDGRRRKRVLVKIIGE